ncbi:unnamed protein product [Sphenostylis stenocarpa]|uniref:NAD(P)H dehydrogenase (quinone) n=1 Tax=Sphenostylis stenocarpa TaxID=92480 RepID=A0AA86W4W5_9FABA|nr:unnamed protein product [Sphenostylis stenocarpa]
MEKNKEVEASTVAAKVCIVNELLKADGFAFGFPTRFGMMPAQFQTFLDSTGSLWDEEEQLFEGKPAGIFLSTGCQGGGQESTALSAIPQLVNRGMIFVPMGHILDSGKCRMRDVIGGSPFGAGTYVDTDGSREPSGIELNQAFHQGKYIATITKKLKRDPKCSLHKIARRRLTQREGIEKQQRDIERSSMAVKVYIVYYSMYGNVERLASEISLGLQSVQDVEATMWQVPETLSIDELSRLKAPAKSDVPIINQLKLCEADAIIFGFPTRFGLMASQFKAFLDSNEFLWKAQMLAQKLAGIFYSTSSQGDGQETAPLSAITHLVHHGMIFVPIGYTFGPGMFEMTEQKGGGPYGAGTYAGDESRKPTELELEQAFHQGKYFANIAKKCYILKKMPFKQLEKLD